PVFRKLWIASLVSGSCVAAHDTAATWIMSTLTPLPVLISLMSTVASLHLFNPGIILVSVFLIGVGFAFNAPTWISIVPHIVSDAELPAAVTLSGLQLNISGIIGRALGGLLIPLIGPSSV